MTAHCTKRSENPFMTDLRLFKLSKLCITKSFLCSFVSIADQTSEGQKKWQNTYKLCLPVQILKLVAVKSLPFLGRLYRLQIVSYVKGYLGCFCAHSTLRSTRDRVADVLQVTLFTTVRMQQDIVWRQRRANVPLLLRGAVGGQHWLRISVP